MYLISVSPFYTEVIGEEEEVIIGNLIGWLGVAFGLLVAPPQLIKIIKSKKIDGISTLTYLALVAALMCYLLHAIYIRSPVFITAQAINLITNTAILVFLLRRRNGVRPTT